MRLGMSNTITNTILFSKIQSYLGYCSNRLRNFNNQFEDNLKSQITVQFTLIKGEVFRIPSICKKIHVLSGSAWLTVAGEDIILTAGEKVSLGSNQDIALLSALGEMPLVLEIC
jgi:hypothetical protein